MLSMYSLEINHRTESYTSIFYFHCPYKAMAFAETHVSEPLTWSEYTGSEYPKEAAGVYVSHLKNRYSMVFTLRRIHFEDTPE